jgi:hypothetical protein
VNWGELLDGLQLDDHAAFDDDVGAESVLEINPVEREGDRLLPHHVQSSPLEDRREYELVHRFEQDRPKPAMNADRSIDDRSGDFVEVHAVCNLHMLA